MVLLIVVSIPISLLNEVNSLAALALIRGTDSLSLIDKSQRDTFAVFFLQLHSCGLIIAELFWGLWLFPLASLVYRSRFLPQFLGVWLALAGAGWVLLHLVGLLLPRYQGTADTWTQPAVFGEIAFMFWLLIKGAKPLASSTLHANPSFIGYNRTYRSRMTQRPFASIAAAILALILIAPCLHAQLPTLSDVDSSAQPAAPGPLPDWDVALVKPHPADDPSMSWQMTDDGMSLKNLPLEQMLYSTWDLKPYQIDGLTAWMKSSRYDLTAKVSGDTVAAYKKLNTAQRRQMLQALLTDRFQLKPHLETRTSAVYNLVVDKSGSKLKPTSIPIPSSPEEEKAHPEKYKGFGMSMGPGMFEATAVSVRGLASQLSNAVSKPVRDQTHLPGLYDITLHYRPEETSAAETSDAPSIFSALQDQLGLKLVPGKGPVETLVVDFAQKPEAN